MRDKVSVAEAMEVICEALRTDWGYRVSWQANIAMAFKDEVARNGSASTHDQANAAADNFLDLLCYRALGVDKTGKGGESK